MRARKVSRLKLGILGCGEVALAKHLPALQELPDIEVVAVADLDPERLRKAQQRFGIPSLHAAAPELLAHPGLEAVAICLPPAHQTDAALAALDADLHVWLEAPIALSLDACDTLIKRSAASNRKITVGFHMRWHRLVRAARAVLTAGRLGQLQTLRAVWNSPRDENTLPVWRRSRAQGGGSLVEVAMDHFDLWRYLLEDEIDEVFAESIGQRWEDESAVLSGRMRSGILLSAVFSERASHDVELEIGGKAGRLRVGCTRFDGLEFYPTNLMPGSPADRLRKLGAFLTGLPRALPRLHRAGDYRISYREQWRHFLHCIRTGDSPAVSLEDGRRALAATLAAASSSHLRRPVRVAEAPAALAPIS